MKSKRITALLAALLLLTSLSACARVRDEAPDLTEMVYSPQDSAPEDSGDGLLEMEDQDVPLTELPSEVSVPQQVIGLLNEQREAQGLPALKTLAAIDAAADVRAQELIASFSHTRPDGTKYRTALEAQGVSAGYTGENAAKGHPTPEAVVTGWMNSEGHRANMLRAEYTYAGAGYAVDPATGTACWVLLFTSDPA